MAHHIDAIVAKLPINRDKAKEFDLPVFVEGDFAVIALNHYHSDHWAEALKIDSKAFSDMIHDTAVTLEFARLIGIEKFALVSTEYFGGVGEQFATVYDQNKRIFDVTEDGINQALNLIGVQKAKGLDEFDSIGLGKHRDFYSHFEKYCS